VILSNEADIKNPSQLIESAENNLCLVIIDLQSPKSRIEKKFQIPTAEGNSNRRRQHRR
jgi:hypothetical protein